jgi:hypothetical protein
VSLFLIMFVRFKTFYMPKIAPHKVFTFFVFMNGKAVDIYACDEMYHIRDFMGIPENWME